ncbi:hypothetical protein KIN20_005614 [Parelaphostrongylus tenuis]|uniref:Uncharacterized protein n=1 Tax=Parelaphostrongylus tenuis TaxID=148309 RepID=A0AAD5M0M6_PARTN|nr:hypothetical protein KIN20_005614 [Parelaphostrongylus tenuis]
MMLPSLSELIYWTGLTVFELWLHVASLLVFLIILPLKLYRIYVISYWVVFSPLFIASALNSYFVFIVFVRSVFEYKDFKGPILRFGFNAMRLSLIALFEVLLCYKVEGDFEHGQVAVRSSYGIVFTPDLDSLSRLMYSNVPTLLDLRSPKHLYKLFPRVSNAP